MVSSDRSRHEGIVAKSQVAFACLDHFLLGAGKVLRGVEGHSCLCRYDCGGHAYRSKAQRDLKRSSNCLIKLVAYLCRLSGLGYL